MTASLTAWTLSMLAEHGPAAVFLGVLIDAFIIPFPSQLVVIAAGALVIEPGLTPAGACGPILWKIVLPGTLGLTLGAFFPYGVAYWGGKPAIDRWKGVLGFGWDDAAASGDRLQGRLGPAIFASRAALVIPLTLISGAAGILRMPVAGFTLWTALGSIPRCLLLGYLGWLFRDSYRSAAGKLGAAQAWGGAAVLLLLLAGGVWLWRRKSSSSTGR
ncbi:MAG: VTT domain-containing protein [Elusimicrobia bacterium]|nr:VTT domain-containing protein [Elusimicrobiota bacterium]